MSELRARFLAHATTCRSHRAPTVRWRSGRRVGSRHLPDRPGRARRDARPDPGTHRPAWRYLHADAATFAWQYGAFLDLSRRVGADPGDRVPGTTVAAVIALPLGFLAARNVVTGRMVHFMTRRGMDCVRSVDTLIWALIWINVVGLGPFAGALAIACTDLAASGQADVGSNRTAEEDRLRACSPWRRALRCDPLRPAAAGVADLRQPGAVFLRIQHPLGNHHRHCRRRWHRPLSFGDDPRA